MTIGNVISDNWGIFMVVGVLALIYAVCYATVCYKLKSWGAPRWFNICCIAFFSLVPVFGAYSQTIIKGWKFQRSVFPFHGNLCGMLHSHPSGKVGQSLRQQLTVLFLVGFGMCITRNNGLYMVLPAFILLFFFLWKKRQTVCSWNGDPCDSGLHGAFRKKWHRDYTLVISLSRVFFFNYQCSRQPDI